MLYFCSVVDFPVFWNSCRDFIRRWNCSWGRRRRLLGKNTLSGIVCLICKWLIFVSILTFCDTGNQNYFLFGPICAICHLWFPKLELVGHHHRHCSACAMPFQCVAPPAANDLPSATCYMAGVCMVCDQVFKQPWPGMMRTVYGNHERFETTYFKKFPGYYTTGDGEYCSCIAAAMSLIVCLSVYHFYRRLSD